MKSLNSFADHAPKRDWLVSFFELKQDFFTEHTLGPMMYDMLFKLLDILKSMFMSLEWTFFLLLRTSLMDQRA